VDQQVSAPSLVDRAKEWLNLAHDYIMQTADGNAAVIAQQLCDEDGFERIMCVMISPAERSSLHALTVQACTLADNLEKHKSLGSILETDQLQPLQYSQYDQLFTEFSSYMEVQLLHEMSESQKLEEMTTTLRSSAADADAMSSIAGQRQQNDDLMASSYHDAIVDVQERITHAQAAVGVTQESLTRTIRSRQAQQAEAFHQAVSDANTAAQVAEVKSGVKLAKTIFVAILAAYPTGGLSLVAAATTLAEDEDVRDQGLDFLRGGLQLYRDLQTDCGSLDVDTCHALLADITASQHDL